jgi:hypothetical protein
MEWLFLCFKFWDKKQVHFPNNMPTFLTKYMGKFSKNKI